jgi:transposase
VATTPQRPTPVEDRLRPLSAVAKARCACPDPRRAGLQGAGAGGQSGAQAFSGGQSECAVHRKGGARGYDGGKKVKERKRHLVVDSQGSVLGVWVSPADVSDARGARVVLAQVLRRYPSAQIVIADGAYDKEGLLEWLLSFVWRWSVCVVRGRFLWCCRVVGWWRVVLRGCWGVVGCRAVMMGYVRWRRVGWSGRVCAG